MIKININEWHYQCGDGCCDTYGTRTTIDGIELENQNQDVCSVVKQVLEHLGIKAEVSFSYNGEEQYTV